MNSKLKGLVVVGLLFSMDLQSKVLPVGFENVFTPTPTQVKIRNLDGTLSVPISFLTTFDSIQLSRDDNTAQAQFQQYLESNAINEAFQEKITEALLQGVHDSGQCVGHISQCNILTDSFDLVYDYNDKQLLLFVSPDILSYDHFSGTEEFYSPYSVSNGLINTSDFYLSQYNDQAAVFSLNDTAIWGLPLGHVYSDFNVTSKGQSELYQFSYDMDYDDTSLTLGHYEYHPQLNTTDFLNVSQRMAQNTVSIASSKRLLRGGVNSDQSLGFYSPQSGNVEVYRDDRLIYQKNVKEGQHAIYYNELPTGRYEVRVDVKSSGEVVNSQYYQVYNNTNDVLSQGEVDYALTAGWLEDSYYQDGESLSSKGEAYSRFALNYRFNAPLLIGASASHALESTLASVGFRYADIDYPLDAEIVYSDFERAHHLNAVVGVSFLNATYEDYVNDDDAFASYMFGHQNYTRLSVSGNHDFGQGRSLYAVYSYYLDQPNAESQQNDTGYEVFSLGYSSPFLSSSRISANVDYSSVDDDVQMYVTLNVPLSSDVSTYANVSANRSGLTQFKTAISKEWTSDSLGVDSQLELSNTYESGLSELTQEASLSMSGSNNAMRFNGHGFVASNGLKGGNLGLSMTQVISGDGVNVTSQSASSYAVLSIESDSEIGDGDERGFVRLSKQSKTDKKEMVYEDTLLLPLTTYSEYSANFDAESVDLFNSGEHSLNVFSHPGTVTTLEPRVSRVVSFIAAFNDINDQPIDHIQCNGDGCLDIEAMSDGVFRISVLESYQFELTSNANDTCLLPYEMSTLEHMNFGGNYCLPIHSFGDASIVNVNGQQVKIQFLGTFEIGLELDAALSSLKEAGYRVIQKQVGESQALFISQVPRTFDVLLGNHQPLIERVQLLAKGVRYLDAISYPIANIH